MSIDADAMKAVVQERERIQARADQLRREVKALEDMLQAERLQRDKTTERLNAAEKREGDLVARLNEATHEGVRVSARAFECGEQTNRLAIALRHVLSPSCWGTPKAWDYGQAILRQEGLDK